MRPNLRDFSSLFTSLTTALSSFLVACIRKWISVLHFLLSQTLTVAGFASHNGTLSSVKKPGGTFLSERVGQVCIALRQFQRSHLNGIDMESSGDSFNSSMEEKYRALAYDTALSTLVAVLVYVVVKVSLDGIRQWRARVSVLIVGSGPVGLTAALVAVRSGKVLKLTVLDERYRTALLCRPQQIALDPGSVRFLLGLGVDFDNMEGCWHNDHFFTKIGVFQEYLLSILEQKKQTIDIKVHLGTKVSRRLPVSTRKKCVWDFGRLTFLNWLFSDCSI